MKHIAPIALSICSVYCTVATADTVSWIDATGFWDVAANWDSGVPSADDDAVINPTGTRIISIRAAGGPFIVNSITMAGDDTLALGGGNIAVNSASSFANFTHSSGVLGGTGDIVVNGTASLALSNLTSVMTGPATTTLKGTTTIGGYAVDNGRILRNEGLVTLTGGIALNRLNDGGAGRIDNAAGAVFDIKTFNLSISATAHADLNARPGFPAFINAGTLSRSSGGNYSIAVPVHNTGLIQLNLGTLSLTAGGTDSGAASLAAGTILALGGGTHEIQSGATFTGPGTLRISGNAIIDFAAATTIASAFNHNTGVITGADLTLTGATTLALSNLTSMMTGPGTTTLQGTTAIGGYALDNGRTLRNEGHATLTGNIQLNRTNDAGAGRIDNAAGALFEIKTFNSNIAATSFADRNTRAGFPAFNNEGILRRNSAGTYTIAVPLSNTGTIDLVTGNLTLTDGSSNAGVNTLASGTTLSLASGNHTIEAGATYTGLGTVALAGAGTVLHMNANSTVATGFSMTGGTIEGADLDLSGPASLTISSSLGVMAGPGTTRLKGSSVIGGGPNNTFGLDGKRVLQNEGSAVITGVIDMNRLNTPGMGSGKIVNTVSGVIDIQTFNQGIKATNWGPLDSGLDALIENAGTFKKTTGGTYSIGVHFHNTGTVSVEAGQLVFARATGSTGTLSVSNGAKLTFSEALLNEGNLRGNGSFDITGGSLLTNGGTLAPGLSVGALTVNGSFAQSADGVFEVELASLSSFDTLTVNGNGTLDGTLKLLSLGGYTPTIGDTFTVATFDDGVADASDLLGSFADLTWAGFAPGIGFSATYVDGAVVINAIAAPVPLPAALWLFLSSVAVLGIRGRSGAKR